MVLTYTENFLQASKAQVLDFFTELGCFLLLNWDVFCYYGKENCKKCLNNAFERQNVLLTCRTYPKHGTYTLQTLPKHFKKKKKIEKKLVEQIEKLTSENSRFWQPEPRFV